MGIFDQEQSDQPHQPDASGNGFKRNPKQEWTRPANPGEGSRGADVSSARPAIDTENEETRRRFMRRIVGGGVLAILAPLAATEGRQVVENVIDKFQELDRKNREAGTRLLHEFLTEPESLTIVDAVVVAAKGTEIHHAPTNGESYKGAGNGHFDTRKDIVLERPVIVTTDDGSQWLLTSNRHSAEYIALSQETKNDLSVGDVSLGEWILENGVVDVEEVDITIEPDDVTFKAYTYTDEGEEIVVGANYVK